MREITQLSAIALLTLGTLSYAAPAGATGQATRTFVSGQGSDTNPCSLAAPCRTLAQALTQTAPSGEITVLNSAGYGPATITQSVTITNPGGVEAGVTATSGETAITVAAGASGIVTLRGLTIEGGGVGYRGIDATSFRTLNIIDCVVKDFTNSPIVIEPSPSGTAQLVIAGTFGLNGGANGLALLPVGAVSLSFAINGSTFDGNGFSGMALDASGVTEGGFTTGTVVGSHFDLNADSGINIANGTNIKVSIKNSTGNNNAQYGVINTEGSAQVFVASSEFSFDVSYGLLNTSGIGFIYTYGNNDLSNDGNPMVGTTSASLK